MVISVSRLDRIYLNMAEVDLLDIMPTAIATHKLTDKNRISDHSPVSVSFSGAKQQPSSGKHAIPKWVTKHVQFLGYLNEAIVSILKLFGQDAFANLLLVKQCFHDAAVQV